MVLDCFFAIFYLIPSVCPIRPMESSWIFLSWGRFHFLWVKFYGNFEFLQILNNHNISANSFEVVEVSSFNTAELACSLCSRMTVFLIFKRDHIVVLPWLHSHFPKDWQQSCLLVIFVDWHHNVLCAVDSWLADIETADFLFYFLHQHLLFSWRSNNLTYCLDQESNERKTINGHNLLEWRDKLQPVDRCSVM